jgi:hypothetical protein
MHRTWTDVRYTFGLAMFQLYSANVGLVVERCHPVGYVHPVTTTLPKVGAFRAFSIAHHNFAL